MSKIGFLTDSCSDIPQELADKYGIEVVGFPINLDGTELSLIHISMDLAEKLEILADSAKYDVACTSSGVERAGKHGSLGSCAQAGICHAFTPDGRCVSLLKVLYSNACSYDCSYCVNRRSNDRPRATFTPRELAELTIGFYRRNYIEGLFLSSAVLGTPDRTMELMIEALRILREDFRFNGYIDVYKRQKLGSSSVSSSEAWKL